MRSDAAIVEREIDATRYADDEKTQTGFRYRKLRAATERRKKFTCVADRTRQTSLYDRGKSEAEIRFGL